MSQFFTLPNVRGLFETIHFNRCKPITVTITPSGTILSECTQADRQSLLPSTCLQVLPIKGQRAADQRVEDDSETPDVHLRPIILLALEKLGGSIGWRATERVQLVTQRELIAEAEVGNLDVGVGIQQKVLRLSPTYIDTEEEEEAGIDNRRKGGKVEENNTMGRK